MTAIDLFFCYAHQDGVLRDDLEKHLSVLKRSGVIRGWHDRRILAGENWKSAIDDHLQAAHVIVPLISADFLASDYCYEIEMKRALERLAQKTARVTPILLRGCDWKHSPLGHLQVLPTDAKPVTSWRNLDEAWADVVRGLREVFEQIANDVHAPSVTVESSAASSLRVVAPVPSVGIYAPHGGLKMVLTEAKDTLISEKLLDEFEPPAAKHWQHKHERVGWRLFVDKRRESFAFMGIYEGESTIHKGIPDVYFFLEMKRGASAQKAFDSKVPQLSERMARLSAQYPTIQWGYDPGGWQSVWAVKSLSDVATSNDVRAVTTQFFRSCVTLLRECGILDDFLLHARAW